MNLEWRRGEVTCTTGLRGRSVIRVDVVRRRGFGGTEGSGSFTSGLRNRRVLGGLSGGRTKHYKIDFSSGSRCH